MINSITRLPFGPLRTATLSPGSGDITLTRNYDLRYNLMGYQTGSSQATYTRDKEGHVTTIDGVLSPTPENLAETSTYDTSSNKLNSRGTISYIHDAVGNITSDGNRTFSYDELNRITEVQQGSTTVATYGYDSSNRRIVKTTGTTTTHYLYDSGSNLIGESQPDGTPIRDYIYLDGELLAQKVYGSQAGLFFYVNDHLGTPQKLIASDGTVVWEAAYLPFGKAQVVTEQITNNIRFPGQYYDSETGLHYNWHRFYDPTTGRYISADPIGLAGGINLYAYVGGDPVNWIDFDGLARGRGPNHTYSLYRNPINSIENFWNEIEKDNTLGPDDGHNEKNENWCSHIHKFMNDPCFKNLDKNLQNQLKQQMDWCKRKFPNNKKFGTPDSSPNNSSNSSYEYTNCDEVAASLAITILIFLMTGGMVGG